MYNIETLNKDIRGLKSSVLGLVEDESKEKANKILRNILKLARMSERQRCIDAIEKIKNYQST